VRPRQHLEHQPLLKNGESAHTFSEGDRHIQPKFQRNAK